MTSATTSPTCNPRSSAPRRDRACGASSRNSFATRTTSTGPRRGSRRQRNRRTRSRDETLSDRDAGVPPAARSGGAYVAAGLFLVPALLLLGALVVYPIFFSVVRSFFDEGGSEFVGL